MKCALYEHNNFITATLGGARLVFSAETGAWLGLCDSGGSYLLDGDNGLSAITLTVGGVSTTSTGYDQLWNIRDTSPVGPGLRLARYYLDNGDIPDGDFHDNGNESDSGAFQNKSDEPDSGALHLILEESGWSIDMTYRYNAMRRRIERSALIAWNGEGEQLLRWAELRMPPLADERGAALDMPGYTNIHHYDVGRMPVGKLGLLEGMDKHACCWQPGLLAVDMPGRGLLISWMFGGDMSGYWQVYRGHRGVWVELKWFCCARLQKGGSIKTGDQYIRLGSGGALRDELNFMHDFWDEVGVKLPDSMPTPDWAKKAFIYETHLGLKSFPRTGRSHNPHPTAKDLTADLPRIADLGFTVVQLMPTFPFPNYSVEDYFDIETCYGPKADMIEMVSRAHELGMKVFVDVVMHGATDKTVSPTNAKHTRHPLLDRHPEYFMYTDDGRVAKTYTWSFDQANESFRAHATEAFCHYVRELDVDGFRVDAITWNYFPNWKPGLPYHAYKSMYGCYGLFPIIRDATWAIKPEITFYTETTGPQMANSYDLSYNYDEVWMYEHLLPPFDKILMLERRNARLDGSKVDARGAAEWLDLRQKVMPRGWIKVHHADSHDSHEWAWVGIFQRDYIGLEQSRALFAYCIFVEGGVMNYAGGEDGSEELYKSLIAMRKTFPALMEGSCEYLAVKSESRNMLTLLRRKGEQTLIPIINFSPDATETTMDATAAVAASTLAATSGNGRSDADTHATYRLTEYFSSATLEIKANELASIPINIEPYSYQLWQVERI